MIGIYDSGVGGISIYKSIKRALPREDFMYVADSAFFPYGERPTAIIRGRGDKICSWFEDRGVKLIVIACNTATVTSLEYLRKLHPNTPIVGTVPVIKTCAERTHNSKIGVLCTPKTAHSAYQKNLIYKFAQGNIVYVAALPDLVEIIEVGAETPFIVSALTEPLRALKEEGIDTLALGCSHFPLVKAEIQGCMGRDVLVLDSGDAIARQVKRVLKKNNITKTGRKPGVSSFYTTARAPKFVTIVSKYLDTKVKVRVLTI